MFFITFLKVLTSGNELLDKAMFEMFLSLLSYIAQNEREKIRERQRQGIEIAKREGRFKGRPVAYSPESNDPQKRLIYHNVVRMLSEKIPVQEIADTNGIVKNTVYKIKRSLEEKTIAI
jgi:DNA invertase Pin-like site-specific DNA recombinase